MRGNIYYVIGDIHGEADQLRQLHKTIIERHRAEFRDTDKTIVHLGDYVDRGPDSYDVIEIVMSLENDPNQKVINLKGNHEQLMLDAYQKDKPCAYHVWLDNGGAQTISSYQDNGLTEPPGRHLDWLAGLPSLHWDKKAGLVFVHAGVDPNRFPFDGEETRLWTRTRSFFDPSCWKSPALTGMRVIHGHTPTQSAAPDISADGRRINVDTGACYGGPLTAAVFAPNQDVQFICT
jgi:calcineurin-like phosphoesterase family protein